MQKTIFISHSADDKEITHFFRDAFDDTYVKPVMMEYEKWSRNQEPNWKWIKKEIRKSKALFVILTKSVVSKIQTQNWIAFEIGVAAGSIPQKPVYVFKEEAVDFPVPYLNHYFPERLFVPSLRLGELDFERLIAESKAKHLLQNLIKAPQLTYDNKMYQCFTCKTAFSYWGKDASFSCPCCKSWILGGMHIPTRPKMCNSCNAQNPANVRVCVKCGNNTFRQVWS